MDMSDYIYKCSAGETFDSVAREVYGDENYAAELLCANPELCLKSTFTGGEVLLLPVVEIPEADSNDTPVQLTAPWEE